MLVFWDSQEKLLKLRVVKMYSKKKQNKEWSISLDRWIERESFLQQKIHLSLSLSFFSLFLFFSLFFLKHNLNTWVVKWRDVFSACKWRSYTFTTNRRWNDFNHFLTILIWILLSTFAWGIAFLSPIRIWGFLIVCGRKYQQLSILKF